MNIKTQMNRTRHFIDILPTRTLRTNRIQRVFIWGDQNCHERHITQSKRILHEYTKTTQYLTNFAAECGISRYVGRRDPCDRHIG